MRKMRDFLLIGVDGGATKVNCWSVKVDENGKFSLGDTNVVHSYSEYSEFDPEFVPVELNIQLAERANGSINLLESEKRQAVAYTKACADAIIEVVRREHRHRILVGIGMPGLKTADQRGISAMANGPRQTNYAENIEKELTNADLELVAPIGHIGSDAFYCGLGEEYALAGQFRDVRNSYYLGGGTGAADALKLQGKLISLDDISEWFLKTWEMKCAEGRSLETYVASRGIQSLFGELSGKTLAGLNSREIYPPQIKAMALQGNQAARTTFEKVAKYLALLLYERITTLYAGWQGFFDFVNPNRPAPEPEHRYLGTLLDRIIIGQRLGDIFRESEKDPILWQPFIQSLNILICESSVLDDDAKSHYCNDGHFDFNRIGYSNLREAPALGAGIDAYLNYKE